MKKGLTYTAILMWLIMCGCAGGASSPTTPAQIPTEISFAENYAFDTGIAVPLGKSVVAEANADFTGGNVIFTNPENGATVIDGSCGTATVDSISISINGPDDWPNKKSECDIAFEYDGEVVPVNVDPITESLSKGIWKSVVGASSVRATYSYSSEVPTKSWATTTTTRILENVRRPSITGADGNIYSCFVTLAGSPLTNSGYGFSISTDNGATFTAPSDISNGGSYTGEGDTIYDLQTKCYVYSRKIGSDVHIAAILYGTEDGCSGSCTQQSLARLSSDGGTTFGEPIELYNKHYTSGQEPDFVSTTIHPTTGGIFVTYHDWIKYCTEASGCGTPYRYIDYEPADSPRIEAKGNYVFVVYDDAAEDHNISLKVLLYSTTSDTFTERTDVQLSDAGAATGDALIDGISTLTRNSDPVIAWHYRNNHDGYVDIYNLSANTLSSELISGDILYMAEPAVDAANSIHLLYYTTDVYYRLYEYDSENNVFTFGNETAAGTIKDVIDSGAMGAVYNSIAGRFYYMYTEDDLITDVPYSMYSYGYMSLIKGVLQ